VVWRLKSDGGGQKCGLKIGAKPKRGGGKNNVNPCFLVNCVKNQQRSEGEASNWYGPQEWGMLVNLEASRRLDEEKSPKRPESGNGEELCGPWKKKKN